MYHKFVSAFNRTTGDVCGTCNFYVICDMIACVVCNRLHILADWVPRMEIVQSLCGFCAEAARRWCCDRAASVLFLSMRPPRNASAGIVQCYLWAAYGLPTGYLRAMDLQYFQICITSR